ncbi:unnamed protein product [Hymenolepis diminuta]|uniref:Uncharacterized protein n=1 Tax=Hymenolepis diminuta TaxID=6216 RepID=A0A564YDW8_HYMDI|nr:unnamed protein product [Hymenolepis diminuta]
MESWRTSLAKNTLLEEKKRLESSMMHRDEELEEVLTVLEVNKDRLKDMLSQLEETLDEQSVQRKECQRIEAQRATLEKQIKEMREKLENEKAAKEKEREVRVNKENM